MKTEQSITTIVKIGILSLFVMMITGCGLGQPPAPTVTPTPTNTPVPTATITKFVSTPTPSALPEPDIELTKEALEAAAQSTSPSEEAIAVELEKIGYTTQKGELGWSQTEPIELTVNEQDSLPLADLEATPPIFANFILSVDIDWGQFAEGNISGCGIAFHAQDNFRGEVILFNIRLQPVFNNWNFEHWDDGYQGSLLGDSEIYKDGVFEAAIRPGINHYLLVVEDGIATAYANEKLIGSGNLPEGLQRGRIAFFPWAFAGSSTCTFTNGWLWRLP